MKQVPIYLVLIVFVMISIACTPTITVEETSSTLLPESEPGPVNPTDEENNHSANVSNEKSCQTPEPEMVQTCADLEEQILGATVRIELHRWQEDAGERGEHIDGGIGHGTVKDGRYIITHNHYPMSLDSIEGTVAGEQIRVSIYKANGEMILDSVQPSAFSIVAEDSETVVLDFGEYVGEGLFTRLGIPSVGFISWQDLSLAPGMEVAQIDWDKDTAHVDWVPIKQVVTSNGTPHLELENGIIKGASGGGVFWNGLHIGNNWTNTTIEEVTGDVVLATFSAAALNSEFVLN